MEYEITFFQFLISCCGLFALFLTAWIHMKISVARLETKIEFIENDVESEKEQTNKQFEHLDGKVDKIFSILSEIKISIAKGQK